jgi:protein O-GlcNAc transferase
MSARTTVTNDPLQAALAHHQRGELDAAAALYGAVLERAPVQPAVLNNLGLVRSAQGRAVEAAALWRQALAIDPTFADAHVNLANLAFEATRLDEARGHYEAALASEARHVAALANGGALALRERHYSRACEWLGRATALAPASVDAWVNLGRALAECGYAERAIAAFDRALGIRPDDPAALANRLLAMHYAETLTPEAIFQAHVAAGRRIEATPRARAPVATGRPAAFRVGFVSGDFNDHAVMRFFEPVLVHRDRSRWSATLFATSLREDGVTSRLYGLADDRASIAGLSDDDAAQLVRSRDLDILVDLSGHSAGSRPGLFARRPAPLAVSWIGYLGTSGLASIDYRLTDAIADPPGLTQRMHTEKLWHLPALWAYAPPSDAPAVGALPATLAGHLTFGSANNPSKITQATLALWSEVLDAVPASRLLVHAHDDPLCRERLADAFRQRGHEARVAYFPRASRAEYLRRLGAMDVVLDCVPYNGGTVTCDALWMGVPVVTLPGDRPFSRSGAATLRAAGTPDWIATDARDFVAIAARLAADIAALARVRAGLRDRIAASRLADGAAMARDFADALASMWSEAGLPAREISR